MTADFATRCAEAVKAVPHRPTCAGWGFSCPKCGGSWFGSAFGPAPERAITTRDCHDEYGVGCRWIGPDSPDLFVVRGACDCDRDERIGRGMAALASVAAGSWRTDFADSDKDKALAAFAEAAK